MPIYEYQCESCGHRQDALQKISDPPLVDCASCGEATLRKLVSAPRFRLKGGGWYETDFKTENRRNLADGGDKPSGEGDGKGKAASGDGREGGTKSGEGGGDKKAAAKKPSTDGSAGSGSAKAANE